jgi:hypothetical protein
LVSPSIGTLRAVVEHRIMTTLSIQTNASPRRKQKWTQVYDTVSLEIPLSKRVRQDAKPLVRQGHTIEQGVAMNAVRQVFQK